MATIEELVQMMNTLQGQRHALYQVMSRLLAESQQFRNAGSPGLAETATDKQFEQRWLKQTHNQINVHQNLVDIKGVGKTPTFREESAKFSEWRRKTTWFLIAAYRSAFRPATEWVDDRESVVTNDALEQPHGSLNDEPVDDRAIKSMLHS